LETFVAIHHDAFAAKLEVRAKFRVSAPSGKRPLGVSALAIALGWLAVGGFGNAVVWHTIPASLLTQLPAGAPVKVIRMAATPLFSALALMYGATALFACVALWRMRRVAARALLWWSLTVVAMFAFILFYSPRELLFPSLVAIMLVVLLLSALRRYVLRAIPQSL
jgi:hypothetical protein